MKPPESGAAPGDSGCSRDEYGPEIPDDRGKPAEPASKFCANHPGRRAAAACAECFKSLCPECVYASGGGHSFCKKCMDASRLVEAEPRIIGRVVEEDAPPASSRTAMLAVFLVLAVLALLAAAFVAWGLLSRG